MMPGAFGAGPVEVVHRCDIATGSADLDDVLAAFAARQRDDGPVLRFSRCRPTAAFSRRDTKLPSYEQAAQIALRHGFEPVVRPVGGRLAAYDEGALVVHLQAGHADPRAALTRRFEGFADAVSVALTRLGLPDVRVGPVPGEYCAGAWSVNVGGQAKLAGTGQRLNKNGYLFSAVVTVTEPGAVRAMLAQAYQVMDLPFATESVGAVDRWLPRIGLDDVTAELDRVLRDLVSSDS
jgi:octanoyl-[GcvH]:protein N-octanoyltransferase